MNDKNKFEVKLKSEMYNHDNEKIIRREDNKTDANNLTLAFIIGFILFIILLILIILFTR